MITMLIMIFHLDQPSCPLLPGGHICGPAPPIMPRGGLIVEHVGLVVGKVVPRVVVVGLRVRCSRCTAVPVWGCLMWVWVILIFFDKKTQTSETYQIKQACRFLGILTLMKELCEYCLDDRRDTMDVAVGNRRCTETSPTPNLFKPIHISDKRLCRGPKTSSAYRHCRMESFCASGKFFARNKSPLI